MTKKRQKRPSSGGRGTHHDRELKRESRTAIAATVGWMLSVLSTFVGQLVVVAGTIVERLHLLGETASLMLNTLAVATVVTCLIALLLMPIALKLREIPPPRSMLAVAIVIGIMPLLSWPFLRA